MIEVFFINGNRAKFEINRVTFIGEKGGFDFRDDCGDIEMMNYKDALMAGAVVNWSAVSFIRLVKSEVDD